MALKSILCLSIIALWNGEWVIRKNLKHSGVKIDSYNNKDEKFGIGE